MIKYEIITADSIELLKQKVSNKSLKGWKVTGNLVIEYIIINRKDGYPGSDTKPIYHQTMVY